MSTEKLRKAYQPTVTKIVDGREVASHTFLSVFASSAEARFFAITRNSWKAGRFNFVKIRTVKVPASQYVTSVQRSERRAA